jgi:hypothetical protein
MIPEGKTFRASAAFNMKSQYEEIDNLDFWSYRASVSLGLVS